MIAIYRFCFGLTHVAELVEKRTVKFMTDVVSLAVVQISFNKIFAFLDC